MEQSEGLGLGVAVVGHVVLFGILSLGIASRPELRAPSEPISVQLTDEVGLVSTAPNPVIDAATAVAPEVGDYQEPEIAEPTPQMPEPAPAPPTPRAAERPAPAPALRPARSSPPPPAPPVSREERRRPDRPTPQRSARAPRLGDNFLEGVTDRPSTSRSQESPASVAGPAVVASLKREVYRQLKPHWQAPSGADVEQLRTELSIRLDQNGNIIGTPRVIRTTGETPSNANQIKLHQERAVKAAQLAAPFDLPAQYYDAWKLLEPIGFYTGL